MEQLNSYLESKMTTEVVCIGLGLLLSLLLQTMYRILCGKREQTSEDEDWSDDDSEESEDEQMRGLRVRESCGGGAHSRTLKRPVIDALPVCCTEVNLNLEPEAMVTCVKGLRHDMSTPKVARDLNGVRGALPRLVRRIPTSPSCYRCTRSCLCRLPPVIAAQTAVNLSRDVQRHTHGGKQGAEHGQQHKRC